MRGQCANSWASSSGRMSVAGTSRNCTSRRHSKVSPLPCHTLWSRSSCNQVYSWHAPTKGRAEARRGQARRDFLPGRHRRGAAFFRARRSDSDNAISADSCIRRCCAGPACSLCAVFRSSLPSPSACRILRQYRDIPDLDSCRHPAPDSHSGPSQGVHESGRLSSVFRAFWPAETAPSWSGSAFRPFADVPVLQPGCFAIHACRFSTSSGRATIVRISAGTSRAPRGEATFPDTRHCGSFADGPCSSPEGIATSDHRPGGNDTFSDRRAQGRPFSTGSGSTVGRCPGRRSSKNAARARPRSSLCRLDHSAHRRGPNPPRSFPRPQGAMVGGQGRGSQAETSPGQSRCAADDLRARPAICSRRHFPRGAR